MHLWFLSNGRISNVRIAASSPTKRFRPCCVLTVIARVRPGVTLERLKRELTPVMASGARLELDIAWLTPAMRGDMGPLALGAMAAAGFLLVVCAGNLANLLTVRSTFRLREYGIRAALGASRVDLARLILVEAALIAGGRRRLGLTRSLLGVVNAVMPAEHTRLGAPAVTARTAVFALVAAASIMSIAALFGWFPVRSVFGRGRTAHALRGRPTRIALAGAQALMATILAGGVGLLLASYSHLATRKTGYDPMSMYVGTRYPIGHRGQTLWEDIARTITKLDRVAGVASAAAISGSVVADGDDRQSLVIGGQTFLEHSFQVTPEFFETAGTTLVQGRPLRTSDSNRAAVVVNQAFVRRYWPDRPALGETLMFSGDRSVATVVGVIENVLANGLAEPAPPTLHSLLDAASAHGAMYYVVRPSDGQMPDSNQMRRAIADVNSRAIVDTPETLGRRLADTVAERTFATLVLTILGAAAACVAAFGLAGVVGFLATRQRRELAIRMALGARRRSLLAVVTLEPVAAGAGGGGAGIVVGHLLAKSLEHLLFGVRATDWAPAVLGAGTALTLMAGTAFLIALRATSLRPADVLRSE